MLANVALLAAQKFTQEYSHLMERYASPGLTSFYILNHEVENVEMHRQLVELKNAGFTGIFMHPRPGITTPYLADAWWEIIDFLIATCRELELDAWIYDENFWPSGGAGGKTVYDKPELRARYLEHNSVRVSGGESITLDLPAGRAIRAFALRRENEKFTGEVLDISSKMGWVTLSWNNNFRHYHFYYPTYQQEGNPHWRGWTDWPSLRLNWTPPDDGEWLALAFCEREMVFPAFGFYLDMFNPAAGKYFVEVTHQEYSRRYKEHFGKTVRGAFTDEPKFLHQFSWSPVLEEEFPGIAGYDLRDYLPHLIFEIDANTPVVRRDFRAVSSQLFLKAFSKPVYDWAQQNGLASTGHISPEEEPLWQSWMTPDLMEWLKWYQMPGVDIVGAHIGDARHPLLSMGAKLVSSVAHQNGHEQVLCESWGTSGWELTLADMKKIADWLFVLGVNVICAHGQFYSIDGHRKREAAPSEFYQAPYWPYFSELAEHIKITGDALTGGRHLCDIAVLHPQTTLSTFPPDTLGTSSMSSDDTASLWCEDFAQMIFSLLGAQRDFDFINEKTFCEAEPAEGALRVGDENYKILILPGLQLIEEKTAQAIARFVENGGKVLALGGAPAQCVRGDFEAATPAARIAATPHFDCIECDNHQLLKNLDAILPRAVRLEGEGAQHIFALRRENSEGRELLFLFNTHFERFAGTLHLSHAGREYSRPVELTPHGSLLLWEDDWKAEERAPEYSRPETRARDISRDWVLQRASDNVLLLAKLHVVDGSQSGPPPIVTNAFVADVCEAYDLPPQLQSATHLWYCAQFAARGDAKKLALCIEEGGVQRPFEIWVNEQRASELQRVRRYDCKNWESDISNLIRSNEYGAPNQLALRVPNLSPNAGTVLRGAATRPVMEAPRLFGDFALHFPYAGYENRAELRFDEKQVHASYPPSWADCGWPQYSGTVRYCKTVSLSEEEAARLGVLCFEAVRDLVRVSLNGEVLETRAWAPFEISVAGKLRVGENEFLLEVANSPINLMEGVARKSGIFGAIELC
jgi:hypothetical protein